MIRWERQEDGSWQGFSGELLVATVRRDEGSPGRWLWNIAAVKRPKGWRKGAGHRTAWLAARSAADEYWERWLEASALRPNLERLALQSLPAGERPRTRRRSASSAKLRPR
jgi:hypothetical protein